MASKQQTRKMRAAKLHEAKIAKPPYVMNKQIGREILLDIADRLDRLHEQPYKLPYFLMQGTALGAYRDQGFTPTEADIDIGFLQEHFSHLAPQIAAEFVAAGYELETWSLPFTQCRTIVVKRQGIKADLVSFIRWEDKRFTTSPRHARQKNPYALVHDHKVLETYQTLEMFGRQWRVPSPIETYLEREYGEDWCTPIRDSVSRTRIHGFEQANNIPHDYLDTQQEPDS